MRTQPALAPARHMQACKRLLAEPLLHFLALGALIFWAYAATQAQVAVADRIEVTPAQLAALRAQALQQWGREPDAQQLGALVQDFIREEVLVREAIATGLDQDDIIVRRRLAQKMEFLAHAEVQTPTEPEQRAFLAAHPEAFLQERGLDLEQLYFSTQRRGAAAATDAQRALRALALQQTPQSDAFMLGAQLRQQTRADLQRDFGSAFASAVAALPPGQWSAPIASAHGLHLVRVTQPDARQQPAFEAVQAQVQAQMVNQRVAQARDAAYARLLARYTVVAPADATGQHSAAAPMQALP